MDELAVMTLSRRMREATRALDDAGDYLAQFHPSKRDVLSNAIRDDLAQAYRRVRIMLGDE